MSNGLHFHTSFNKTGPDPIGYVGVCLPLTLKRRTSTSSHNTYVLIEPNKYESTRSNLANVKATVQQHHGHGASAS